MGIHTISRHIRDSVALKSFCPQKLLPNTNAKDCFRLSSPRETHHQAIFIFALTDPIDSHNPSPTSQKQTTRLATNLLTTSQNVVWTSPPPP